MENEKRTKGRSALRCAPVLQESLQFNNRPQKVGSNDDSGRSSTTKPTSNLRGISIDMALVYSDESSDIMSEEKPFDEYFSPLSEDSTQQPSMRPRPPISVRHDEAEKQTATPQQENPIAPPSAQPHSYYNQQKANDSIKPSETVMSSRRAKILAKVSSRITRLRQDKKLNDRFTVPKMDGVGPNSLPELQDLCIIKPTKPEVEPAPEKEQVEQVQAVAKPEKIRPAAKPVSRKGPPGKSKTCRSENQNTANSTNLEKQSTKAVKEPQVQNLSLRTEQEPSIHVRSSGCKTPNPSPAVATIKSSTLVSIPEEEDIISTPVSTKESSTTPPPPPPINISTMKDGATDQSSSECKTEPETPQMTNTTKSFHAQNLQDLKICIDAYSHSQYLDLMDSLSMSRGVRTISVIRKHESEGVRTRRPADLDHLFHVLHTLSGSLSELYLWNFRLQDLTSVSLGVYDHASIQHLQLHMETGTLDEDTSKALGSMPQLVSLELEVKESFPLWPLLESNTLTVLSIVGGHFAFDPPDILDMSDKLEVNETLQILDLEPRMPAWCLITLVTSIRACPDCNLETFQFSCKPKDVQDGDACMLELIKLIKSLQSKLRVVWNHCAELFEVSKKVQDMATMSMYVCDALHQFQVFKESDEYRDLKTHILERNMREAVERDSGNMYEL